MIKLSKKKITKKIQKNNDERINLLIKYKFFYILLQAIFID